MLIHVICFVYPVLVAGFLFAFWINTRILQETKTHNMINTVTVQELEDRAKEGEHVAIVYQCPLNPDYLIVFYL